MSLAVLARKHRAKKKATKGSCFNIAMTGRGSVRKNIRKAKNCCSKLPSDSKPSCDCKKDTVTGCSYKGCMNRPFFQNSYRNHLKKIKEGCNCTEVLKCKLDTTASEEIEKVKAYAIKDLSNNYASQCLSCKKDCSNKKADVIKNAFPAVPEACRINTQKCNTPGQLTRLYVKKHWCNTVKDLGMRGSADRIATLKAKLLTCRNADGSSLTNPCECVTTQKKCA